MTQPDDDFVLGEDFAPAITSHRTSGTRRRRPTTPSNRPSGGPDRRRPRLGDRCGAVARGIEVNEWDALEQARIIGPEDDYRGPFGYPSTRSVPAFCRKISRSRALRVSAAARSNSARASPCRPSRASRSPVRRVAADTGPARRCRLQRVDDLQAPAGPLRHAHRDRPVQLDDRRRRRRGTAPGRARRSGPSRSPRSTGRRAWQAAIAACSVYGPSRRRAARPGRARPGRGGSAAGPSGAGPGRASRIGCAVRVGAGRQSATPGSPSARPGRAPRARRGSSAGQDPAQPQRLLAQRRAASSRRRRSPSSPR